MIKKTYDRRTHKQKNGTTTPNRLVAHFIRQMVKTKQNKILLSPHLCWTDQIRSTCGCCWSHQIIPSPHLPQWSQKCDWREWEEGRHHGRTDGHGGGGDDRRTNAINIRSRRQQKDKKWMNYYRHSLWNEKKRGALWDWSNFNKVCVVLKERKYFTLFEKFLTKNGRKGGKIVENSLFSDYLMLFLVIKWKNFEQIQPKNEDWIWWTIIFDKKCKNFQGVKGFDFQFPISLQYFVANWWIFFRY